jgi:5-bromo-4-chloroindolyl phosphate hydrolysis protein
MDSFIHADIFFFITSIAVIVVGIVLTIVLVYIAIILNTIRKISEMVHSESGLIAEDVHDIRNKIRTGRFTLAGIFRLFQQLFAVSKRRTKTKKD